MKSGISVVEAVIMHRASLLCLGFVFAAATFTAAEVPSQPLGKKGAPVFTDDFARPELGKAWRVAFPTFAPADGVLAADQTNPKHGAVASVKVGQKDMIIEFKFRLEGATSIAAVCDDHGYKDSHGGHICRVSMTPSAMYLGDDKERLSTAMEKMRDDPQRKEEYRKLSAPRQQSIQTKFEAGRWYQVTMEIVGDEMRVTLDGKPVGYLKSSGLAHPTKSDLHFTVNGGKASFDDLGIWAVEPH